MTTQLKIGLYTFEYVCALDPFHNHDGTVMAFMPQARYHNQNRLDLHRYGAGPFCKLNIPRSHKQSGVYAITVADLTVMYIGECVDLFTRFNGGYGNISPRNCFVGGRETNCRLNNLIYQATSSGSALSLWFLPTDNYKQLERTLRALECPPWNRC